MPVIYKEDGSGNNLDLDTIVKADPNFTDNGELLAVVYAPEYRDSQGDVASAPVIKEMMYAAAQEGESIDIRHDGKPLPKGQAFIAERFIVQKGDGRFSDMKDYSGKVVDVTGAWATVIKIEDPALRQLYKDGKWNGVSMGGTASVDAEKSEDGGTVDRLLAGLGKLFGLHKADGDDDMTPEQMKKVLDDNNASLITGLSTTLAKILKPEADDKGGDKGKGADTDKAPVFAGDIMKIEDVRAHANAITAFNLRKSVKMDDPASLAAHLASLEKSAADGTRTLTADEQRIAALEKEAAELRGRSNQPVGGSGTDTRTAIEKEQDATVETAKAAMAILNKQRGRGVKTA